MRFLRGRLYRMGFRPRPGSIWYSPSLAWIYAMKDVDFLGAFQEGWDRAQKLKEKNAES